jgi:hypothetical protein
MTGVVFQIKKYLRAEQLLVKIYEQKQLGIE